MAELRMIAARAIAIVVAVAGVAGARPVTPPPGWKSDDARASSLTDQLASSGTEGATKSTGRVEVYLAPQRGVALFVTDIIALPPAGTANAATRAYVDELHESVKRAQVTSQTIQEDTWGQHIDPAHKQVEAELVFRDTSAGLITRDRLLIAADDTRLEAVTGECVAASDAPAPLVDACKAALATLEVGIDAGHRIALDPASAPPPAAGLAPTAAPAPPPAPIDNGQVSRLHDDQGHTPLPPIVVHHEEPMSDRRPIYLGAGIVVLAALFWWNRRRRAELERADADADALQAAARGDKSGADVVGNKDKAQKDD